MTEGHKHPNYIGIWVVLIILTVVELLVAQLPHWMEGTQNILRTTIILLVGLALAKAALVGLYFMHLRFERRTFVLIVTAPLVLALVLVFGLLPDVGFRG
ncbi:MAG TPA: cytochrome C oxidase subunit IV family protein [Planctomycetota bacterium]|nr:cytochrome C oxidase subunit IV family protein [Planctomycetota bacterium]